MSSAVTLIFGSIGVKKCPIEKSSFKMDVPIIYKMDVQTVTRQSPLFSRQMNFFCEYQFTR